jgi:hypothetical protein
MKHLQSPALKALLFLLFICCFALAARSQTTDTAAKTSVSGSAAKDTTIKTSSHKSHTKDTTTKASAHKSHTKDTTTKASIKKLAAKLVAPIIRTPTAIIDTFFKKFKVEGTRAAVDYLFGTNKLFNNAAQLTLLKVKLDSLQAVAGLYLGKELIAQKTAGTSLVFYSYLVKFANSPVRFTFMFYRPQTEWVLYRFNYDDAMDRELEEAGRIYNKHP